MNFIRIFIEIYIYFLLVKINKVLYLIIKYKIIYYDKINLIGDWGLGIGDWGLGIWGWGPYPKPQNQNPKPPTPKKKFIIILIN